MNENARGLDITFPIPSRNVPCKPKKFSMAKPIARKRACICISICACMQYKPLGLLSYLNIKDCKNR